ncbi:MAG: DEAD/DEAH box helicase, partial [bacterium]|nr:DEAD/DEAH box helicase [bacterium]
MLQLRPYQKKALAELRRNFLQGFRRLLLRAPTGAGKTVIACGLISGAVAKGTRVLFLAHRTELIEQCSRKLTEFGINHGIIKAGYKPIHSAPVQVASVQSLARRDTIEPGLIFVDEAHHANAATYKGILARFPQAIVIGLTATPARTDGRGLGEIFQIILETVDYWDLLEHGFLVPMRLVEPSTPDLSGVKTVAGDYNQKQKAERMRSPRIYGDIVDTWKRMGEGRPTLMFAASVAHSLELCARFRAEGVVAEHVDGTTDEDRRARLFREIQAGHIDILSNVGVATEGTDLPAVSAVILANPTKSI